MKKHRKIGNATSNNFFTSEFKLKPAQPSKQLRNRKMNTTLNSFKHQMLQEQTKRQRQQSKDKKPFIEELKFLHHKEDDFKLPQSITKRSLSKVKEQSRLKIESKNNQLYQQHYQEITVPKGEEERKNQVYHLLDAKRSKPIHLKNALKQKLEKTALEKFNEAISKENEENQNVVSEKTAECLYNLLKTNRMNQLKQHKFKSLPSENEEEEKAYNKQENGKKQIGKGAETFENKRKSIQSNFVETKKDTSIKDIVRSKEVLFKNFEEKDNTQVQNIKKPNIPQPETAPLKSQAQKDVIQFKKVPCDNSQKERFSQSEVQSQQDSDSFQLKQQSSIAPKISMKKQESDKIVEETQKNKTINEPPNNIRKGSQKFSEKEVEKIEKQKIQKKEAAPLPSNKEIVQQKKPAKIEQPSKRYEQSDLDNIPRVEAVNKDAFRQSNDKPQQKNSSSKQGQTIQLNDKKIEIEKILTTKYFQGGDRPPSTKNANTKINPPPKLHTSTPKGVATYKGSTYDQQIEQFDFGGGKFAPKPAIQTKKQQITPTLPKILPQSTKKSVDTKNQKTVLAAPPTKQSPKVPQPKPQQTHPQEEQQDDVGLNDELQYFIQRIEDIGQYRINSKDVYNDKSIDKQLFKIHKICAYYMAHQFLFLVSRTCNHFKSAHFDNDFFDITCEQLTHLKEEGILDDEVANLQQNMQQSKKLLKKCYEQCKMYLKAEQQILILDGKTNYHIRCCAYLIKQFRKIYELYQKNPKNRVMMQRCVYLIEIYCVLKLLNGEEIKQFEQFSQIENPAQHIETYKKILMIS